MASNMDMDKIIPRQHKAPTLSHVLQYAVFTQDKHDQLYRSSKISQTLHGVYPTKFRALQVMRALREEYDSDFIPCRQKSRPDFPFRNKIGKMTIGKETVPGYHFIVSKPVDGDRDGPNDYEPSDEEAWIWYQPTPVYADQEVDGNLRTTSALDIEEILTAELRSVADVALLTDTVDADRFWWKEGEDELHYRVEEEEPTEAAGGSK